MKTKQDNEEEEIKKSIFSVEKREKKAKKMKNKRIQ